MNLLVQLELGAVARPIYDMIMDLDTESMTVPQLEGAIHRVLTLHGCDACADAVVAALAEVGFAGLRPREARGRDGEDDAADDAGTARASGGRARAS